MGWSSLCLFFLVRSPVFYTGFFIAALLRPPFLSSRFSCAVFFSELSSLSASALGRCRQRLSPRVGVRKPPVVFSRPPPSFFCRADAFMSPRVSPAWFCKNFFLFGDFPAMMSFPQTCVVFPLPARHMMRVDFSLFSLPHTMRFKRPFRFLLAFSCFPGLSSLRQSHTF